jgi:DNA-binding NarL/FixJ family response regulator
LPALELLVRARAALGQLEAAATGYQELEQTTAQVGTPYLLGRARLVASDLARARDDPDEARRACEDAVDLFDAGGAAYDAGLARLGLARALADLGRDQAAAAEVRAARRSLDALGVAGRITGGADDQPAADTQRRALFADLTSRELEVLQLVAEGLSDAEIAERLVLSPHTVHRHVANVRTKLRLPSRAAAVAYAARAGLL